MPASDCINTIICGDIMDVLPPIPAETFNCVVTSPPYWGLRAYKTTPVIWGGQKDCRHNFAIPEIKTFDYKTSAGPSSKNPKSTLTKSSKLQASHTVEMGTFCSLCSAWRGELGLEPTIELYIEHLMMVFGELKRVLRKDGVCFVNIGDTYGGSGMGVSYAGQTKGPQSILRDDLSYMPDVGHTRGRYDKTLMGAPERFVLAMMKQGWIRRCNIIWAKGFSFARPNCNNQIPIEQGDLLFDDDDKAKFKQCDGVGVCNKCGQPVTYSGSCMPDSAKDRPNHNGFEWVYMFTKSKKYWYEQQYEAQTGLSHSKGNKLAPPIESAGIGHKDWHKYTPATELPLGRTIRNVWAIKDNDVLWQYFLEFLEQYKDDEKISNVWAINPQAFPDAHFATFPEELVEKCLKMGCPEFVCKKCGKARSKIYKSEYQNQSMTETEKYSQKNRQFGTNPTYGRGQAKNIEIGLTDCGCNAGWIPGLALDPFAGSGTTAVVAYKLKRNYTMIDLSKEYCRMGRKRLNHQKKQYGLLE